MNRISLLLSTSLVACAFAGPPALAQQTSGQAPGPAQDDAYRLEEVVVTSERRTSTAQKTAASVSVRSGQDMLLQGRYELRDILQDVPGIVGGAASAPLTAKGSGSDNPAAGLIIRGIASNSGTGGNAISAAASAAIYVDDVYSGIGGGYDVSRVEVLRGPQGTLYGRSATSGVVAISTGAPSASQFSATGAVELGSYDLLHYTGAVNIPLIEDKLGIRISGNRFERDGYYSEKGGALSTSDLRIKALWTPTENISALFGYAQSDNTTNSGGVSIKQDGAPDRFIREEVIFATSKNEFKQYWANFNIDLGPVSVNYIPALRTWYQNGTFYGRTPPVFMADQTVLVPEDDFITHELRLRNTNRDSRLQWQAGVTYYDNKIYVEDILKNVGPAPFEYYNRSYTHKSTKELGVFAEGTYSLLPDTRLTVGLRYDHTKIQTEQDYAGPFGPFVRLDGDEGRLVFDKINYKLRLERDLTPQNLLYASLSTGSSPGDISLVATLPDHIPVAQTLESQTLTAFEIGSKNRYFDNRLQINGSAYYYDYGGYQAANINNNPDQFGVPTFETITLPVENYGFELELEARPSENGVISFNVAYTHAEYSDLGDKAFLFHTDKVLNVAPVEANLAYSHRIPIGSSTLMLRGAVRYFSEHDRGRLLREWIDLGAGPYVRVESQFIGDLNATYLVNEQVSLTAYVRNITDNRYLPENWNVAAVLPGPILSTDIPALSDPRTVGFVLNYSY